MTNHKDEGGNKGLSQDEVFESGGFPIPGDELQRGAMDKTVPAKPRPAGVNHQASVPLIPAMIIPGDTSSRTARVPWSTAKVPTVPSDFERAFAGNSRAPELANMHVSSDINKSMKEYAGLVCHLETRGEGQIRLILNELRTYLPMMRQSQAAKVYEACPLLKNPNTFLTFLAGRYPASQEVVPGMSLYDAAIRELGNALWLIFGTVGLREGVEKLKDLTDGRFEYNFKGFRESLARRDDEPAPLDVELDFWLSRLTPQERRIIEERWRVPPKASEMIAHLEEMYPREYHAYVINLFSNSLFLLFSHCTIDDRSTPERLVQESFTNLLETSAGYLKQLWEGKHPLPLPSEIPLVLEPARVTARTRQNLDEYIDIDPDSEK